MIEVKVGRRHEMRLIGRNVSVREDIKGFEESKTLKTCVRTSSFNCASCVAADTPCKKRGHQGISNLTYLHFLTMCHTVLLHCSVRLFIYGHMAVPSHVEHSYRATNWIL